MSKLSDRIGGFATIPNTIVKLMPQLGVDAFSLWSYLRFRTNGESGLAFPSYETIQKDTGLHPRKIAAALRKLESFDIMSRHKRFGRSTEYELLCPTPEPDASPSTIGRAVLPPLEAQSFHRGQTNKIESNKTDSNKSTASTDAGDPPQKTSVEAFAEMESAGGTNVLPAAPVPRSPEDARASVKETLDRPDLGQGYISEEATAKALKVALQLNLALVTQNLTPQKDQFAVANKLLDKETPRWGDGTKVSLQEQIAVLSEWVSKKKFIENTYWVPSHLRAHFGKLLPPDKRAQVAPVPDVPPEQIERRTNWDPKISTEWKRPERKRYG